MQKMSTAIGDIQKSAAYLRNPELVENFVRVAKVRLPQGDATAEVSEFFPRLFNCVRILIEREHIGARLQNRFGMTAAADCAIDNQRAGMRRQKFDRFSGQHRAMVSEIFHFLRLLFQNERTGRKPNGPLKQ